MILCEISPDTQVMLWLILSAFSCPKLHTEADTEEQGLSSYQTKSATERTVSPETQHKSTQTLFFLISIIPTC